MKKKEKKFGLTKCIILLIVIALVFTWLIPTGMFQASGFVSDNTLIRVGLNDLLALPFYGIYFSLDKIIFLMVLGGFYGLLQKIPAYDRLVRGIASKLQKKPKLTVVLTSVLIAVFTSVMTECFAVLLFVPFIVAILNRMKLDKFTILVSTFGSMLVGLLGATYGTEGLTSFVNYFASGDVLAGDIIGNSVLVRAGILVIGLILFNFFTLAHMDKKDKNLESSDMFEVIEDKESKKTNYIPLIIIGGFLLILCILGFVDWYTNFGIDIFDTFDDMVMNFTIGKDFYIFKDLLGNNMEVSWAFGTWDLYILSPIVFLFTIIIALTYRIRLNDYIEGFKNGLKRMLKPIACVIAAFMLIVIIYMSPYLATILNKILSITEGFNLATMSLVALLCNILHTDLLFTGYTIGEYLAAEYVDYINPIVVIFTSLYGLVQFFIPTSIVLGIGLTTLNVKYSDWLKYIWKFLLGMVVCLLIIFILITLI